MRRTTFLATLGLLVGLVVSGCSPNTPSTPYDVPVTQHQNSVNWLRANDVQVIEVGDTAKFVLSTDEVFLKQSTDLNPAMIGVLNNLAGVVLTYPGASVTVTGYSDSQGSYKQQVAWSKERAQVIASLLWNNGLNADAVIVKGLGSSNAISTNETPKGSRQNRRIEIFVSQR